MDWKNFIIQISEGAKDLCVDSLINYKNSVSSDMQKFLEKSRSNFEKWSQQVQDGRLSKEDYESLVKRQMAGAEFIAIKQAGLGKIEIEKLISGIINVIVDSTFKLLV
jgi:hypothetical protein